MRWALLISILLSGCLNTGKLRTGRVELTPPGNASVPSVVNSGEKKTETVIPAGTEKKTVETQATATTPAKTETVYTFPSETRETVVEQTDSVTLANERAPDQTVALRKADNAARSPLLWAAIGSAVVALGFLIMKWPTPAAASGVAAVVFFLAWHSSGLPSWFWMLGIGLLIAGAAVMLGYKRAEWDADGDGIPDAMQKKVTTQTTTVVEPKP